MAKLSRAIGFFDGRDSDGLDLLSRMLFHVLNITREGRVAKVTVEVADPEEYSGRGPE